MTTSTKQPAIQARLDSLTPVERHRVLEILNDEWWTYDAWRFPEPDTMQTRLDYLNDVIREARWELNPA